MSALLLSRKYKIAAITTPHPHPHPYPPPSSRSRNLPQRKKKKSYPKKYPDISIIGISKLRDPCFPTWGKIIWLAILFVVTYICYYQLYFCFSTYISAPLIKDVSIIRTTKLQFPVLYVCPGFTRSVFLAIVNTLKNKSPACERGDFKNNNCFDTYSPYKNIVIKYFNYVNNSRVDKFWMNETGISADSIKLYKPCSNLHSENCTVDGELINVNTTQVPSFWGGCLAIATDFKVTYHGPFTYLKLVYDSRQQKLADNIKRELISLNATEDGLHRAGLLFYIRSGFSPHSGHSLFYLAQEILEGYLVHFELSVKKFKLLNTALEPCSDGNSFDHCTNHCMDNYLSKLNVTCRMPYINNSLEFCNGSDVYLTHLSNYKDYIGFDTSKNCNCYQSCVEDRFTVSQDVIDRIRGRATTHIKMYFTDGSYEQTTARYAYDFYILLSDVGGNLGFFLGFCLLSVAEIVEFVMYVILKRFDKFSKK